MDRCGLHALVLFWYRHGHGDGQVNPIALRPPRPQPDRVAPPPPNLP